MNAACLLLCVRLACSVRERRWRCASAHCCTPPAIKILRSSVGHGDAYKAGERERKKESGGIEVVTARASRHPSPAPLTPAAPAAPAGYQQQRASNLPLHMSSHPPGGTPSQKPPSVVGLALFLPRETDGFWGHTCNPYTHSSLARVPTPGQPLHNRWTRPHRRLMQTKVPPLHPAGLWMSAKELPSMAI